MPTSDHRLLARARLPRAAIGLVLPALALLLSGCGGGVGEVSGKVTFKGKPVVYGSVGFVGADGLPRSARINPDGTYTVKDVALGEAKITVDSTLPSQSGGGGRRPQRDDPNAPKDAPKVDRSEREEAPEVIPPEVRKQWFAIPVDYSDVAKTKLRYIVRKGQNTHDIQLD